MLDKLCVPCYNGYSKEKEEIKMGKVKAKVTEREIVRNILQSVLLENGSNLVGRTKEGLVLEVNGSHVVVRTILKKGKVEVNEMLETFQ